MTIVLFQFDSRTKSFICPLILLFLILMLALPAFSTSPGVAPVAAHVSLENYDCSGFELTLNDRSIVVSRGVCRVGNKTITVAESTNLKIPVCLQLDFEQEPFTITADDSKETFYKRMPVGCLAGHGTAPVAALVVPGSLRVYKNQDGRAGKACEEGVDYVVDPKWTAIRRLPAGACAEGEKVFIDYSVYRRRVDSIVVTALGKVNLVCGEPSQFAPSPPELLPGDTLLANVFATAIDQPIDVQSVMPVYSLQKFHDPVFDELNQEALVKTNKILHSGGKLNLAFCGDSVTTGCFSTTKKQSFPCLFTDRLAAKFPHCTISKTVFGIPGANSTLAFPKFMEMVMPKHPDLIVIEIVNDISLDRATILRNYGTFFSMARASGAEVILCLPHLPAPSYYRVKGWSAVSGKPYFSVVQQLAKDNNVAIANIASRWENSASQGVDPMLLLADYANHPNNRGHEIYAEELINCFQ